VKKISAFILMTCLFFTVMGYHFIFRMRINEAKKEMTARLLAQNSSELTQFQLTPEKMSALQWENEKEFALDGQMYDVVEIKSGSGIVSLKCIPDHKETALLEQYIKTDTSSGSEKQPWLPLLQLATAQFISSSIDCFFPLSFDIDNNFPSLSVNTSSVFFPVQVPPPRAC
jgi:hypothetical protein